MSAVEDTGAGHGRRGHGVRARRGEVHVGRGRLRFRGGRVLASRHGTGAARRVTGPGLPRRAGRRRWRGKGVAWRWLVGGFWVARRVGVAQAVAGKLAAVLHGGVDRSVALLGCPLPGTGTGTGVSGGEVAAANGEEKAVNFARDVQYISAQRHRAKNQPVHPFWAKLIFLGTGICQSTGKKAQAGLRLSSAGRACPSKKTAAPADRHSLASH